MEAMAERKARRSTKAVPGDDVSEAQIAVHWQEEGYFAPPKEFVAQANLREKSVFKRFTLEKFPGYYKEFAELLDWYKKWDKLFDGSKPPFWRWYVGAKINACYNCVDRHLVKQRNKTALHFVPELENEPIQHITYQELYVRVNEFAALLREFCGLKAGDRVTLYMPMIPELAIAMLACARIGATHSVIFGGFSAEAVAERNNDAKARLVVTADGSWRRGKIVPLKQNVDEAVKDCPSVQSVVVYRRNASDTSMQPGRDHWWHELMENASAGCH